MKSITIRLLLAALIVMAPMLGIAQNRGNMGDMQKRIVAQRDALKKDLKLTKKQNADFKKAYEKYDKKREKLFTEARAAGDRAGMRDKMTELRKGLNVDLKKVMTKKQYKQFLKIEKKKNDLRGQGRGQGGGRLGGRGDR